MKMKIISIQVFSIRSVQAVDAFIGNGDKRGKLGEVENPYLLTVLFHQQMLFWGARQH